MRHCLLIILFLLLTITLAFGESPYDSAGLLTVKVSPVISLDLQTGLFTYRYGLRNSPDSQERMNDFNLTIGAKQGIVKVLQAEGKKSWDGSHPYMYDDLNTYIIDWMAHSRKNIPPEALDFPDPETVVPGDYIFDLGAVAKNLPGIRFFWIQGWVPPMSVDGALNQINTKKGTKYEILEQVPLKDRYEVLPNFRPPHIDSFNGKTVGPDILPDTLTNEQLLDRLMNLKEQVFQLKWIDNRGVANSLNQKLDAAKKKIQAKEIKTAINILHAFIHELEAQRGKHIDDNAFYLLKPNAEYLIFKMEKP